MTTRRRFITLGAGTAVSAVLSPRSLRGLSGVSALSYDQPPTPLLGSSIPKFLEPVPRRRGRDDNAAVFGPHLHPGAFYQPEATGDLLRNSHTEAVTPTGQLHLHNVLHDILRISCAISRGYTTPRLRFSLG